MTHHSKSKRSRLSNIFSQSAPSVLEPLQETDEEAQPVTSNHKMLAPPPPRPSRLHRLSLFMSPLRTTIDTKLAKDRPAIPPKNALPLQTTTTTNNIETTFYDAPPTRAPPPAPIGPAVDENPLAQFDLGLPDSTPQTTLSPADPDLADTTSPRTTRHLHKEQPRQRALSTVAPDHSPHASLEIRKQRGNSLTPPNGTAGRAVSSPMISTSRPVSYNSGEDSSPATPEGTSTSTRKSWIGKLTKSRHASKDLDTDLPAAWINAGPHKIIYSINALLSGDKVPEMWDEQNPNADAYVYLFPRDSGRGPQFKVPSDVLSCSQALLRVAFGDIYSNHARPRSFDGRSSLTTEDATRNLAVQSPETTPYQTHNGNANGSTSSHSQGSSESINSLAESGPIHLYFPVGLASMGPQFSPQDVQKLVDVRNLFAFLTGQPLVSTRACPTTFRTYLSIAEMLKLWQFSNMDGSSFGEGAEASFAFCCAEQELADARNNRERIVEALILGEKMRSKELYNEAFAHAAGQYNAVSTMKTLWNEVSPNTRSRLERASLDLINRQKTVNIFITDFEFPSVFAGLAASTSSPESKIVRFKTWKSSFWSLRRHILSYYRDLHGQWPPKASSKKNNFVEGGLNRLVLKGLSNDLNRLYDYLVDRDPNSFTTRTIDSDENDDSSVSPASAALRKLLGEFDRSSPPVKPPIPFDIPLIPAVESVTPDWSRLSPKDKHKNANRRLKDHETTLILAKSHNLDAEKHISPFLDSFKSFEEKEASGKSAADMAEIRYGHWIFLYCCIQTLPYLVMDAPGLKFTEGVEYFLCEPPIGNSPWVEDADGIKMSWYGVTGGQGVVSLPSDIVNYGVEATYRRSHCWVVANKWLGNDPVEDIPEDSGDEESMLSPLSPPPGFAGGELGLRPSVRRRERSGSSAGSLAAPHMHNRSRSRQSQRNSIALGLERLPIPNMGEGEYLNSPILNSGGSRAASPFGRPQSPFSAGGRRPASRGFDATMRDGGATPTSAVEKKGSTFDDILGSMSGGDEGKKKKGKK